MLKSVLISVFLLFSIGVLAQQPKKKVPLRCDTVSTIGPICIPGAVYYEYTVMGPNGVIMYQGVCRNNCMIERPLYRAGWVILCENVVTSPQIGVLVRQPPMKFYVR